MGLSEEPARDAWDTPETFAVNVLSWSTALPMAIFTVLPTASWFDPRPSGSTQEAGSRISSLARSGTSPDSSCSPSASGGEPRLSLNFLPLADSRYLGVTRYMGSTEPTPSIFSILAMSESVSPLTEPKPSRTSASSGLYSVGPSSSFEPGVDCSETFWTNRAFSLPNAATVLSM